MSGELRNPDFEALGLADDDADGGNTLFAAAGAAAACAPVSSLSEQDLLEPALSPVYRSVSNMVLQQPVVYRSLRVSDSSPSVMSLDAAAKHGFGFAQAKDAVSFEDAMADAHLATQTKQKLQLRVAEPEAPARRTAAPLRRKLASYQPAAVFALAEVDNCEAMIARIESALRAVGVDAGAWAARSSSFPCAIVRDCDAYRFDVYLLELDADCKRTAGATHIVELQRISSGGCVSAWGAVVRAIMERLEGACFGGFFAERAAASSLPPPPSPTGFALQRQSSSSSPVPEEEEDEDMSSSAGLAPADDAALDAEYAALVARACDVKPEHWEMRVQMTQLMARISGTADGARRLAAAGAVDAALRVLQTLVLSNQVASDESARALCTALGNMCQHVRADEASIAYDLAAHTAMHVLHAGDARDHRQMELLREAARALALLSGSLRGQSDLREQIRHTVSACAAGSRDTRLAAHASAILQNLNAVA